jgi:hypothetical protein
VPLPENQFGWPTFSSNWETWPMQWFIVSQTLAITRGPQAWREGRDDIT